MLSRRNRFHGRTVLLRLFRRSTTVRFGYLRLDYAQNTGRLRVAVIVSKKVSKSAVVRNRIRRRVFEIMRRYVQAHSVEADIAITVHETQAATMPAVKLQRDVESLLAKLPTSGK